jgi:predicted outer membrane repeat protein
MSIGGNPTIVACVFEGNTAEVGDGGAIYNGTGGPAFIDCLFIGNHAAILGGVIFSDLATFSMVNCTLADNTAYRAGGIRNYAAVDMTLLNCILWGNRDVDGGGLSAQITSTGSCDVVDYCCIEGWDGSFGGEGNIGDDPLFVDPQNGNYRLSADSPCIDAGHPDFEPEPGQKDLDGHARVLCSRVDMGAYEFGIGDYDCDRQVDLTDFANWESCMTGPDSASYPEACLPFDFELDYDVDLSDFAGFQQALTETG